MCKHIAICYELQRAQKRFVNLAKQDPGRAKQKQSSNIRNKFHQTTYKPFLEPLYSA